MKNNCTLKFQTICRAINSALREEDITSDEALEQMCALMPETLKKGQWSAPEHNTIMILKKRLVVWDIYEGEIRLRDLESYLQGN